MLDFFFSRFLVTLHVFNPFYPHGKEKNIIPRPLTLHVVHVLLRDGLREDIRMKNRHQTCYYPVQHSGLSSL